MNERAANLSVDSAPPDEAKAPELNLPAVSRAGLKQAVCRAEAAGWPEENRAAPEGDNHWVADTASPSPDTGNFDDAAFNAPDECRFGIEQPKRFSGLDRQEPFALRTRMTRVRAA